MISEISSLEEYYQETLKTVSLPPESMEWFAYVFGNILIEAIELRDVVHSFYALEDGATNEVVSELGDVLFFAVHGLKFTNGIEGVITLEEMDKPPIECIELIEQFAKQSADLFWKSWYKKRPLDIEEKITIRTNMIWIMQNISKIAKDMGVKANGRPRLLTIARMNRQKLYERHGK